MSTVNWTIYRMNYNYTQVQERRNLYLGKVITSMTFVGTAQLYSCNATNSDFYYTLMQWRQKLSLATRQKWSSSTQLTEWDIKNLFLLSIHENGRENTQNAHSKCQHESCLVAAGDDFPALSRSSRERWNYDFNKCWCFPLQELSSLRFASLRDVLSLPIVKVCNAWEKSSQEAHKMLKMENVHVRDFFLLSLFRSAGSFMHVLQIALHGRVMCCVFVRCLWAAERRRVIIHFSPSAWITRWRRRARMCALSPTRQFQFWWGIFNFHSLTISLDGNIISRST